MSGVFHRSTKASYPTVARGEGVYLYDKTGKPYLDGSGGAAVSCLGHGHPAVLQAIRDQLDKVAFAHTAFFTSDPSEALAHHLLKNAPAGLARVYFVSGGSEANETALKMARQYFLEINEPQRTRFIARRQSYHGNTLGALALGGNKARRAPFEALLMEVSHISPCNAYRNQREGESPEDYGARAAAELAEEIERLGPERVAGFFAEPVVGATGGVVPPAPGYFKQIRQICDRYGVLLILDEVMSGMGRTGTRYAIEQDGVAPDILTCAKGLGGGYQPIGAVLASGKLYNALDAGSGMLYGGFTYLGHPTACAAALAVQETIEKENLLENVRARGGELMGALQERFGQHPAVGDIRGRGLFVGVELVRDRVSKAPFDPAFELNLAIKKQAMAHGLVCYPGGGTVDGTAGDHVLLAPPFVYESRHVTELVDKLETSIKVALDETGAN